MHPMFNYPWQQLVLDTFMELNPVSLQSKANKAERVICERLRDPTPTFHERTALHNALRELQLLFPQNSKQQESREMKNTHVRLLPRTRASAAKSRVVEQLSTSETGKVLQISSGAVKARMPSAKRELKNRKRSRRSAQ
jgi:DNA-directed RNA polymerase specialized sigma24 family protein